MSRPSIETERLAGLRSEVIAEIHKLIDAAETITLSAPRASARMIENSVYRLDQIQQRLAAGPVRSSYPKSPSRNPSSRQNDES